MLQNIFKRKIRDMNTLFNGHYVDVRSYYALSFDEIPCVSFIGELDVARAFVHIEEKVGPMVVSLYQHSYFDHTEQRMFFNNTLFVLKNKRMIELADNYCHLLHTPHQYSWGDSLIKELGAFRVVKENKIIGFATHNGMN